MRLWATGPGHRAGLTGKGWPFAGGYAALRLGLTCLFALVFFAVAVVLVWRKADDWMAWLSSLQLVTSGVVDSTRFVVSTHTAWRIPGVALAVLTGDFVFLALALFPNGRFVPRWARWPVLGGLAGSSLLTLGVSLASPAVSLSGPFGEGLFFSLAGCLLMAQIYRFWRASSPVERQQTKWVVFGAALALLGEGVLFLLEVFLPTLSQSGSLYALVQATMTILLLLLFPPAFAIALLRYRLWEIDTILNKALVYGSLTALLGALYAGLIIGLESLAGLFGGQATRNPLVLIISTLAIAALFLPVRRRLQTLIDRRFYRKKYDAEKTLATFSAGLRNEVDLEQIRAQVLYVVQVTMQPTHVSLWLRQPERHPTKQAYLSEPHGTRPGNDDPC